MIALFRTSDRKSVVASSDRGRLQETSSPNHWSFAWNNTHSHDRDTATHNYHFNAPKVHISNANMIFPVFGKSMQMMFTCRKQVHTFPWGLGQIYFSKRVQTNHNIGFQFCARQAPYILTDAASPFPIKPGNKVERRWRPTFLQNYIVEANHSLLSALKRQTQRTR